jgi:uncharacterized protein
MNKIIPLFPLNLVIYPNSKYPLHIFEERYKKMINQCIKSNTGFGIVSIIRHNISDIGCYTKVENIIQTFENGDFDIIVNGEKRIKVIATDSHPDGYQTAEVKDYRDINTKADQFIINELRLKLERMIDEIDFKLEKEFWINFDNSSTKSFKVAEKAGLSLSKQQKLLNLRNENNRMLFLIDHLDELYLKVKRENLLKDFILRDGFIN